VGAGGWGISDDFHQPSLSLDETFDELESKSFRLIASWHVWQAATGWSGWSDTWRAGPRR
jgi:hypothetical protein